MAPPRGKYCTVDTQVVLNLIQKRGLVQLVTPDDSKLIFDFTWPDF